MDNPAKYDDASTNDYLNDILGELEMIRSVLEAIQNTLDAIGDK